MEEIFSEKLLITDSNKGFIAEFWAEIQPGIREEMLRDLHSDSDRVNYMLNNKQVKTFLGNFEEFFRTKNASYASKSRTQAESLASKSDFKKALALGSQSVILSPIQGIDNKVDQGYTLALAYWSRSSTLLNLSYPDEALMDIQLAKEHSISKIVPSSEILKRVVLCYALMKDTEDEFGKFFNIFLNTCSNQKEVNELNQQIEQFRNKLSIEINDITEETTDPNGIREEIDPVYGRNVVAAKDLKAGDTLIVEHPLVSCLMPRCFGSHCQKCYNRFECAILNLLIGSGLSALCYLALRCLTSNQFDNDFSNFCAHSHVRKHNDYMQKALIACFLTRCLQISKYITNTDQINETATIMLWLLQILQFNVHEIFETQSISLGQHPNVNYIAIGLYKETSKLNHSCYPGTYRFFQNNKLILKTLKPFKSGESIMENYGPNCYRMSFEERQDILKARYWFRCECEACVQDWPQLKQLETNNHIVMRCPKCFNGIQMLRCSEFRTFLKCPKCQFKEIDVVNMVKVIEEIDKNYKVGQNMLSAGSIDEGMKILNDAINKFYQVAKMPHYQTLMAQQNVRKYGSQKGNVFT